MANYSSRMDFRKLVRSFFFAFMGVRHVFRTEQNMRCHVLVAILVGIAAILFRVAIWEWIVLILCIGLVMAAECFNSAVERLADRITKEEHYLIQLAKDAAAGGVLMISLVSALIGAIVFIPHLVALFQ